MYGHVLQPKPKVCGILAQLAQYNKFVEGGLKNQARTTANMELDDNQTRIRGTYMNELTV